MSSESSSCPVCINYAESINVHLIYCVNVFRLAGDQRARRDVRPDSDAEDDDDVQKVEICLLSRTYFTIGNCMLGQTSPDRVSLSPPLSRRCSRLS